MNNFKIGQRVVCITTFEGVIPPDTSPIKDKIYTISKFNTSPLTGLGFWLKEINSVYSYNAKGFKPLDESFAEEVEANIAKQVKEEELVTI